MPGATPEQLAAIEVGLTVADLERSRAFYRTFAGLEELPPVHDARFGTTKYGFRHGATTVSLRRFGVTLPADTGSSGIQYVVSKVDVVDALAKERHVAVEPPLSGLSGFDLRTIWLDDPDGITNYSPRPVRAGRHATPHPRDSDSVEKRKRRVGCPTRRFCRWALRSSRATRPSPF